MKLRTEILKDYTGGWVTILNYPFQQAQFYWFNTKKEAQEFIRNVKKGGANCLK